LSGTAISLHEHYTADGNYFEIKMKKINVSTSKYPNSFVLISDEDYERVSQFKWTARGSADSRTLYATRSIKINGNQE
jgi:hypothetical protein